VTIMLMDEGLDTGDIVSQRAVPIAPDDTTATLGEKLSRLGADLLSKRLLVWIEGMLPRLPQDERVATQTRLLRKEDGTIDWRLPAATIARQVRAYTPWPGTATTWQGKLLKVLRATALEDGEAPVSEVASPPSEVAVQAIGQVRLHTSNAAKALVVQCGQGTLRLEVLQLEGKRALNADEFVRGQPGIVGALLGTAG
jgi:methionyl-tRNA formyltransferase